VAVEGRRRLNLICVGHGSPLVILEAGLGDSSLTWAAIQDGFAKLTQVCAYDRAGYGFSDSAARPSTAANNADDLQRLVTAADLPTPFVLVAHSLGGLYATLFAGLHRSEVSGMVLVDPSFASQNQEIAQLSTETQRAGSDAFLHWIIHRSERCLALAKRGTLSETTTDPKGRLLDNPDPALNAISHRQYLQAKTHAANLSEILSISSFDADKASADSRAADAASHDFGALPLIVLTWGDPTPPPPFFDAETQSKVYAAWKQGHDRLAAYSSIGQSRTVANADHYIQREQPAAVLNAVLEVIRAVRISALRP
jgi:pimeloyl-ACP methyl ester carboxylesterase